MPAKNNHWAILGWARANIRATHPSGKSFWPSKPNNFDHWVIYVLNMPWLFPMLKLGRVIFQKILHVAKNTSLHLTWKISTIFFKQLSKGIFETNGGYCLFSCSSGNKNWDTATIHRSTMHDEKWTNLQDCEYAMNLLETPLSLSNISEHRYTEASKHIVSVKDAGQSLQGIGYHIIPSDMRSPEKSLPCSWTGWHLLNREQKWNQCTNQSRKAEWNCTRSIPCEITSNSGKF